MREVKALEKYLLYEAEFGDRLRKENAYLRQLLKEAKDIMNCDEAEIKRLNEAKEGVGKDMKYRKLPIVIEAFRWEDDCNLFSEDIPGWFKDNLKTDFYFSNMNLFIRTLEGNMKVNDGDYIIKGVNDEFYPCKPDIFEKTYEKVEE